MKTKTPRPATLRGLMLPLLAGLATTTARADDLLERMLGRGAAGCAECRALLENPVDGKTGHDSRRWAPSPGVDFTHMKLELTILDMNAPVMQARQTLTVAAAHRAVSTITLDARGLAIASVAAEGRKATHTYDGNRLVVTFDPPLSAEETTDVVTRYEVRDPARGLYWTPESPAWPGRPAQVHSQGQPETNSYWFPCHDFPNEKLTTELIVTAPQGYEVLSNGHLAERASRVMDRPNPAGTGELSGDLTAYDEWRWVQDKPHVNYLVSLVVGKFDVVDVGSKALPMPVYAPFGRGNDARATYGRTASMIDFFGRRLGEAYPWDKYAQAVVWNFIAGGMENTSATTMYDTAILDARALVDTDLDGLISHELAHQWFGDLMTCQSWEHVWLNEGWATYMSQLWFEHRDGRNAYDAGVRGLYDGVIGGDHGTLPDTPGMASRAYRDSWEPFRRSANPYGKGASILAMLRAKLGDDAFFKGVALYIDRHKYTNVVTSDFRRALEDASGEALEQFFAQWVYRPDVPRLAVDAAWDQAAKTLTLTARQTQAIDGLNPAFELDLPVWVREGAPPGAWVKTTLAIRGRETRAVLGLHGAPEAIAFDPEQTVIADIACEHPASRSATLVTEGPTFGARVQGLRGLGRSKDVPAATLAMLQELALDKSVARSLRAEAVRSLTALNDHQSLSSLAAVSIDAWEVREAVASGLGALCGPGKVGGTSRNHAEKSLLSAWQKDPSMRVRATVLRSLAAMHSNEASGLALAAARTESQDDELRRAAMDALATLDTAEGLKAVIAMTRPGVLTRTRADALGRLAGLAHHDKDAALEAAAACVNEREQRPRLAAGQALADLHDARGVKVLRDRLAKVTEPSEQQMLQGWIAALEAAAK